MSKYEKRALNLFKKLTTLKENDALDFIHAEVAEFLEEELTPFLKKVAGIEANKEFEITYYPDDKVGSSAYTVVVSSIDEEEAKKTFKTQYPKTMILSTREKK